MRTHKLIALLILWLIGTPPGIALEVTDDSGSEVRLTRPATRIISLAPHITELLFAVGAGENIVATVEFSDFPNDARDIMRIGNSQHLSYEALVSLTPDLVIAWGTGNGEAIISRLKALDVAVYVNEPRTLPHIARSLRHFGLLSGRSEMGERAAEDFLEQYNALLNDNKHQQPVSVFYQIWNEPLTTLNDNHVASDVIRLCGGVNIFGQTAAIAPRINVESVIEADPEVIIVSGMGESKPEWLDKWREWPDITAVKNSRLHLLQADLLQRHTPRLLEGARRLCEIISRARAG